MKCFVTGGAGFIGSHLVDALIKNGHEVIVIDDLSYGLKENVNQAAKFIKLDIRDKQIKEVFEQEKPEILFHLAAQKDVRISMEKPCLDAEVNIIGSLNLLENCRKNNTKIIFSSTGGAIYGETENRPTSENEPERPVSPYGVAKLALEKYLHYYQQVFHLSSISLRYSNVYGPRQDPKGEAGVVAIFLDKLLTGQTPIINGDGRQTRDYIFVSDVVESNLRVMEGQGAGIYNIGTSVETDVNQLLENIVTLGGFSVKEKHGPPIFGEQKNSCLAIKKAGQELNWSPKVDLKAGLKITLDWFKKIYEKK